MRTLTLNIDDSIFQKVIRMLESFPKEYLEIVDSNPTQEFIPTYGGRYESKGKIAKTERKQKR